MSISYGHPQISQGVHCTRKILLDEEMDHRVFRFATGGQCTNLSRIFKFIEINLNFLVESKLLPRIRKNFAIWTLISDLSDHYKFCFYCSATHVTSQVLQPKSVNKLNRGTTLLEVSIIELKIQCEFASFALIITRQASKVLS